MRFSEQVLDQYRDDPETCTILKLARLHPDKRVGELTEKFIQVALELRDVLVNTEPGS